VRADLVAVEPGPPDVLQRRLDVVVRQITDVGRARRVVRREVLTLFRLGQQIEPGEKERHARVVLFGEFQESLEEAVADVARTVPGKDDELRRGLAGFEGPGPAGLLRLLPGEGGGTVTDGAYGVFASLVSAVATVSGTPDPAGAVSQCGTAARDSHRGRGPDSEPQRSPSADVAHSVPIRRALRPCRMDTGLEGTTNTWVPGHTHIFR
jgi:hypothetical protein